MNPPDWSKTLLGSGDIFMNYDTVGRKLLVRVDVGEDAYVLVSVDDDDARLMARNILTWVNAPPASSDKLDS